MTGIGSFPRAALVRYGRPDGRWVLFATVLGSGMAFLDATVVNIALPHIGARLSTPAPPSLQWIVNGYTLSLASLILLGGSLGDRFGRRRIFVVGVAWFAAASLLCGLAPNVGPADRGAGAAGQSAARCSRPARWRSSRRRSIPTTVPARSAPGPGSAASPGRSGRSSAAGSSRRPPGGWSS